MNVIDMLYQEKIIGTSNKEFQMDSASEAAVLEHAFSSNLEGKYLTFALGQEEFGIEILKVREIFGYMDITAIPRTPDFVKGVINLRGQVIPVIDLRLKFDMPEAEVTEQTCIIDVEATHGERHFQTGIIVDSVSEVLDIAAESIEESPQFGSSVNTEFILGMGKVADSVKILLDIDKVLESECLANLAE